MNSCSSLKIASNRNVRTYLENPLLHFMQCLLWIHLENIYRERGRGEREGEVKREREIERERERQRERDRGW